MKTIQKISLYFLIALISFTFVACESMITEVDMPALQKQLVIHSFIAPQDTVVRVEVGLTASLKYNENPVNIDNATVIMKNSKGLSVTLPPAPKQKGIYSVKAKDFKIEQGETYYLEVTTPDGLKASASTKVPTTKVDKNTLKVSSSADKSTYKIYIISFKDMVTEKNYYHIPSIIEEYKYVNSVDYLNSYFYIDKINLGQLFDNYYEGGNYAVVDDSNYNGSYVILKIRDDSSISNLIYRKMLLRINNINEAYYRYQKTVGNLQENKGNPFAEAITPFSNITGGLGIFAAANKNLFEIDLLNNYAVNAVY